jgi:hypothetical protein
MSDIVRNILTDLERTRENLLALSDDIWLNIEHNDSEALKAGTAFKLAYNEKMAEFDRLATALSALVQQYTDVRIEEETSPQERTDSNERVILELDRETPHDLSENFTYKRPFGFILRDRAFQNIVTWRRLYELVCKVVIEFQEAPRSGVAGEHRPSLLVGYSGFVTDPETLRSPMKVAEDVYVEANLSANYIRDAIKKLLKAYSIPNSDLRIYLREDRDAASEDGA